MRKLEADLEVRLVERVGRGEVRLTPAGETLFAFVAPFFEDLPSVVRELRAERHGGTLKIHAAGVVIRELLPGWLQRLRRTHPSIHVHLEEPNDRSLQQLQRGEIDLVLDYLSRGAARVETRVVAEHKPFVVLPASWPMARRRFDPKLLADADFVGYPLGTAQRGLQEQALEVFGARPARITSAGSSESIVALVSAGLGYSIVPSLSPKGPRRAGVVTRPFPRREVSLPIHAAYKTSRVPNRLLEAFLATTSG